MTYFVDYGPDWPPPLEPPAKPRRSRRLLAWCLFWVAFYVCLGIGGLVGIQLRTDAQPVQGAETEVTTVVGPPPHPNGAHP